MCFPLFSSLGVGNEVKASRLLDELSLEINSLLTVQIPVVLCPPRWKVGGPNPLSPYISAPVDHRLPHQEYSMLYCFQFCANAGIVMNIHDKLNTPDPSSQCEGAGQPDYSCTCMVASKQQIGNLTRNWELRCLTNSRVYDVRLQYLMQHLLSLCAKRSRHVRVIKQNGI